MRAGEDGEHLAAAREGLPLQVGAGHVTDERAVLAPVASEQEGEVVADEPVLPLDDQRGEGVLSVIAKMRSRSRSR